MSSCSDIRPRSNFCMLVELLRPRHRAVRYILNCARSALYRGGHLEHLLGVQSVTAHPGPGPGKKKNRSKEGWEDGTPPPPLGRAISTSSPAPLQGSIQRLCVSRALRGGRGKEEPLSAIATVLHSAHLRCLMFGDSNP